MSKPNKDGWIRHRGGKCPVETGVLVDVRYRDGGKAFGQPALMSGSVDSRWAASWDHAAQPFDIMAYRLHKPEQVEPDISIEPVETVRSAEQMRDRIREIDSTVESLEEERVSLVQKLEAEGFRLIDKKDVEKKEFMKEMVRQYEKVLSGADTETW